MEAPFEKGEPRRTSANRERTRQARKSGQILPAFVSEIDASNALPAALPAAGKKPSEVRDARGGSDADTGHDHSGTDQDGGRRELFQDDFRASHLAGSDPKVLLDDGSLRAAGTCGGLAYSNAIRAGDESALYESGAGETLDGFLSSLLKRDEIELDRSRRH